MTNLGAMRGTKEGLAGELDWRFGDMTRRFLQLVKHKRIEYDEHAALITLPNFLKYNGPTSPNHVKAWGLILSSLPECDLRRATLHRMTVVLNKKWIKGQQGFWYSFLEGLPDEIRDGVEGAIKDDAPDAIKHAIESPSGNRERERDREREREYVPATLAAWRELWEGKYQTKFVTPPSRVRLALGKIEKELGDDSVVARMRECLNTPDAFWAEKQHPLALFVSQVNQFGGVKTRSKGKHIEALERSGQAALRRRGLVD
jgi:hypothetical protein